MLELNERRLVVAEEPGATLECRTYNELDGWEPAPSLLDGRWERRLLLDERMALAPLLTQRRQLDRAKPEERSELHPEDNLNDRGSIELRKIVFGRGRAAQRCASQRTRAEGAAGGHDRAVSSIA